MALVGEAGVGKSRLVYEFVHSHHTQGWRVLESASVSYGKATPYFPVIDLLKRYCHVEERDDARTIRAKVTGQVLTLDETLQETAPAAAGAPGCPAGRTAPSCSLDPPQRRQRTLEALKRVLLRESQVQPLLLVFEDLHWIDAETQALLDSLVESLPTARLLLLVNYRPEYQHGWGSKTYYTQAAARPAAAGQRRRALAGPAGGRPQPGAAQAAPDRAHRGQPLLPGGERAHPGGDRGAGRRAGGLSPGAGAADHPGAGHGAGGAGGAHRPPAAGGEAPPPDRRGHWHGGALRRCCRPLPSCPRTALHRGLAHLQAAEFLYETRLFPEPEYTFKHALTHEVAYGSLLQERRRALHARIVEALEALAADRLAEQVERLAHHALRGEVWDKAVTYCQQAGARAYDRAAFREAVACLRAGPPGPRAPARDPATPGAGHRSPPASLGALAAALGEYGRRLALLGEAEALARALDDRARLGRVLARMAHALRHDGRHRRRHGGGPAGPRARGRARRQRSCRCKHLMPGAWSTMTIGDFGRAAELLGRTWRQWTRGVWHRARLGTRADPVPGVAGADLAGRARGLSPRAGATGRRRSASPR